MSVTMGPKSSAFALTRRQTLMWLDHELYPTAPYHNVTTTVRLRGPLDGTRLEQAYRQTVRDIDYLGLIVSATEPVQWFDPSLLPPFELVDFTSDPRAYAAWDAERTCRRFDLGAPLFRITLARLAPEEHILHLCQHHIIADGKSALWMIGHMSALYEGRRPPAPPSFRPYAEYELGYQGSEQQKGDAAYWDGKLGKDTPPLSFYGRPRTSRDVFVDRRWIGAAEDRLRALDAIATHEAFQVLGPAVSRLVAATTLLAAYVHRVTGSPDVVVATPHGNRSADFASTCGLLMEQLFLKVAFEAGETYASLGRKVRKEVVESLRHGRYCVSARGHSFVSLNLLLDPTVPFETLGGEVELTEAYTTLPVSVSEGDLRNTVGLQIRRFGRGSARMPFDLHHATFAGELADRAKGHFEKLWDAMATNVDAPLDSVDLTGDSERRLILGYASGPVPDRRADDVVEQIGRQVAASPQALAVVSGLEKLSYRELDERSNRLARHLVQIGVTRGTLTCICLPRGLDELTAWLAVLKAGGAYVPVDPTHPVDRTRLILQDASPRVAITTRSLAPAFRELASCAVVLVEEASLATLGLDGRAMQPSSSDEQLAYVLFTSGSTGRPKGVEVRRGGLSNFLASMARTPGLASSDRLLAITTTTFDIAALELLLPLCVGATVEIADKDTAADPRLLRAVLERSRDPITTLQATPATWRLLVEAGWQGDGRLKMLCGGEAMSRELADKLLARGGELFNMYGPTETTVWSCYKRVTDDDVGITVGRPIDRTRVYVLAGGGTLAPLGTVGEIHIGGAGVAGGYRGRPDLTSERFLPDPWGEQDGRVYRTGDLGRMLENGEIECLGRVDFQLKIRGFRIEPGEIEAVLRAVPGVNEALVMQGSDSNGDPMLAAYFTGPTADGAELAAKARASLPLYMQPQAYVHVASFALNTNGKIDRKQLPAPGREHVPRTIALAPRNDLEVRMAGLWQKLLRLPRVGVDEDFFALGGSSSLAIELAACVRKELGVSLALKAIFETPTISALVTKLGVSTSAAPITIALGQGYPDEPPLFCLHGIHLYQDFANALAPWKSVVAMHVPIRASAARRLTVETIAQSYVQLIRQCQPHGPYDLGGLCFAGTLAFEAARQLEAAGEAVRTVVVFDAALPRAFTTDRVRMTRELLRRFGRAPLDVIARAGTALFARGNGRHSASAENDDLPVTGPEAEAMIERYQTTVRPIHAHVVLVRRLHPSVPPWVTTSPDLGWSPLAPRLTCRAVDAPHLDLVRAPHVRETADLLGSIFGVGQIA